MIKKLSTAHSFLNIIPISAICGDNMEVLKHKILEFLPIGDKYYPDDRITDKDINFRVSEIIREKVLGLTRQEVPHSIAVFIEDLQPRPDSDITDIKAIVYVERPSQKSIVIGRNGSVMKEVGSLARVEIEKLLNRKVFLSLWVKVLKNWRNDSRAIKKLGLY